MDNESLKRQFAGIGARVKVGEVKVVRSGIVRMRFDAGINISVDAQGEFFDIKIDSEDPRDYRVIDLRSEQRHLLLMSEIDKAKFLCGFDERHWFVCAVPGEGVTSVRSAMEALQPAEVRQATAPGDGALDRVKALVEHPGFSMANPNRVRALIGAFASVSATTAGTEG